MKLEDIEERETVNDITQKSQLKEEERPISLSRLEKKRLIARPVQY